MPADATYDPYQQVQYVQDGYGAYPQQQQQQYGAADMYANSLADYDFDSENGGYGGYGEIVTIGPRTDIAAYQQDIVQQQVYQQPQGYSTVELQAPVRSRVEPLAIEGPGLPPGSKIIAEYILSYIEGEQETQPEYVENIFFF
jgi:hypothetical protein